jgi:hypothetical protein
MSFIVGVGVEAAPAKSVRHTVVSERTTDNAAKTALTSNQTSSAIACVFPEFTDDRETLDAQIDLLLDLDAVWSSAEFSTMLPQSCRSQNDRKDDIAWQSAKIIHVLRKNGTDFLCSSETYSDRHVLECYSLSRGPTAFAPIKVEWTVQQDSARM